MFEDITGNERRDKDYERIVREMDALNSEGQRILDDVYQFIGRFVSYPNDSARIAHTLWIAHTHAMDLWDSTPRIAFLSPEPGSGKTRALEISELLVPNPIEAVNATPAYLFRKISDPDGQPTILYDEIDTIFGPKAKENEEIRGILNAGHRRGAVAGRCVPRGKEIVTEELPAYCAVALAGLGGLPDTILSRSVVIKMKRRGPDEHVDPFRRRIFVDEGSALRDKLSAWVAENVAVKKWPKLPPEIQDRDADVWESLILIADCAGGDWPSNARRSAVALVADTRKESPSLGLKLLQDLKTVFRDQDAMPTKDILEALHQLDEAPWSNLKGKPLDARRLATILNKYGVRSKNINVGERRPKGYTRADLSDPWSRYLDKAPNECATDATDATDSKTTKVCDHDQNGETNADAYRKASNGE